MTQPDATPTPQDGGQTPDAPWGDDDNFDADKAKKLIANLRGENTKLKNRPVLTDEHQQKLAEFERFQQANQTELERVQGDLTRWQTEAESWRKAAVGSKIQALAAESFADPTDAIAALGDQNFLDAGGQIDEAAIKRELDGVLKVKPHWAKPVDTTPRAPAPSTAQGSSANGAGHGDPAQEFAAILQGSLPR